MNQAKLVIAILTLAGSFLAILVSIVIIALIIQKVSLHRVRFYIMINLCITNIVTLLMVIFGIIYSLSDGVPIKDDKMNIASSIVGTVTTITHINSLLTTAFLSIDRYIAVCCIQYTVYRMCCYRYIAGQNVVSPNVGA